MIIKTVSTVKHVKLLDPTVSSCNPFIYILD